nr:MoxR family ATPase [Evansella tamaricis]
MDKKYDHVLTSIEKNLSSVVYGKGKESKLLIIALLSGGHVLIEGVPGTGKTMLIKTLAKSIESEFRRIQCNPDLLPTDITGFSIYHPKDEQFVFRPGPVMTNFLLIDEINRASTKTQSALLEAMEEKQVTVDGIVYPIPEPFFVMATQNPIEFEGTYLLPEAQLDRFMMKFHLGYPEKKTEKEILYSHGSFSIPEIKAVTNLATLQEIQRDVSQVYVSESVVDYLLTIAEKTRTHPSIFLGVSPRGTLALMDGVKALAYLEKRDFVTPDDVKTLLPYVFFHRMILEPEAQMNGNTVESIMETVLEEVEVPIRLEK